MVLDFGDSDDDRFRSRLFLHNLMIHSPENKLRRTSRRWRPLTAALLRFRSGDSIWQRESECRHEGRDRHFSDVRSKMFRLFTLIAMSALLVSCGDAYPKLKNLGGDYVYWMATDDLVFIIKGSPNGPNTSIIPESIDSIAKHQEWVFGHITPYPEVLAGAKTPESARGYFYLNVTTGDHTIGMSEPDWVKFLSTKAIEDPLELLEPHL